MKRMPRPNRKAERRLAILDAARHVAVREGAEGTTLRALAHRDVTRGVEDRESSFGLAAGSGHAPHSARGAAVGSPIRAVS